MEVKRPYATPREAFRFPVSLASNQRVGSSNLSGRATLFNYFRFDSVGKNRKLLPHRDQLPLIPLKITFKKITARGVRLIIPRALAGSRAEMRENSRIFLPSYLQCFPNAG